ncbi:uncharacterized protein LOC133462210 [Cololabis saira]|uniref:uncharacterized protein LOC133462210 n=1 Tax=Cololabis saira TaxID=129043 RepID=UPI002AD254C3|nr:uncharacterized protein LOC133462210 [Cololabis saira]
MKLYTIITVFYTTFDFIQVSGSSLSDKVHQNPSEMFVKSGETTDINCSHSIDNYDRILWYQQSDGSLQVLGYMCVVSIKKITGDANKGKTCTFHLLVEQTGPEMGAGCRASNSNSFNITFIICMLMFLYFPVNKGASDTKRVDQTPPAIFKRDGESVDSEIKCSHEIQYYEFILWYKQDKLGALKLLGYLNMEFQNPEEDVKGKISFDGDGRKKSSLTVSDLKLNDSAVYFCAARRHSATDSLKVFTKTSIYLFDWQTRPSDS